MTYKERRADEVHIVLSPIISDAKRIVSEYAELSPLEKLDRILSGANSRRTLELPREDGNCEPLGAPCITWQSHWNFEWKVYSVWLGFGWPGNGISLTYGELLPSYSFWSCRSGNEKMNAGKAEYVKRMSFLMSLY